MNEAIVRAPLVRAAVIGAGFVGPHHVDAIRRTGYGPKYVCLHQLTTYLSVVVRRAIQK